MHSSKSDAIISAWRKESDVLSYKQIKDYLVGRGIISETNDRSPSRWLRNLVNSGILKKTDNGYVLQMKPKAYQVFDYLNEARQKYSRHIYEGEVGGWISHICAMTYLNFGETLIQEPDEKIAFEIISVRLAELFWALYELRNHLIKKQSGLRQIALPDTVVRETFFAMLTDSIGNHQPTDKILHKFSKALGSSQRSLFRKLWERNQPNRKKRNYMYLLDDDFFLDSLPEDLKNLKKHFKKVANIDIDGYGIEELVRKFISIHEWIEKNHEQEMRTKHSYMLTREESELESNYRMAIMAKIAEKVKELGTNLEDFAIILTRHPATMNQYYTPEHILYEAMEWAKGPPEDESLRELWYEVHQREKSFEGMVAERLVTMGRRNVQVYENLRSKPWVRMELAKHGNFDKILELYSRELKRRLRRRREKDIFKALGLPREIVNQQKTK